MTGTKDVLVANNTLFQCDYAFRLWDYAVKGESIQIRSNLILGSFQADMVFADSGGDPAKLRGAGDGKLVTSSSGGWRWDHNWREVKAPPRANSFLAKAWIPPGKEDERRDEIEVLSRKPAETDFLRPAAKSPLATQGAGRTDPSLPSYVGALPPPGTEPWDWTRTWQAPPPGVLLAVSKDSKDLGTYRTISAAVKAAKPWATIRVLDDQAYDEEVILDDDKRHRGISLEAPRGAQLVINGGRKRAVLVKNVANVRVRGFRMRQTDAPPASAFVTAYLTDGLVLEDLDLRGSANVDGIKLQTGVAPMQNPTVIRRCTIQDTYDGIFIWGEPQSNAKPLPTGKMRIQNNRIFKGRRAGIIVYRGVAKADITGNAIWKQRFAIQFENTWFDKQRVVVANNTLFDCDFGLRFWMEGEETTPGPGRFYNNLLFDIEWSDIRYFVQPAKNKDFFTGDYEELRRRWAFFNNCRALGVTEPEQALHPAPTDGDTKIAKVELSRDLDDPNFLRPAKGSPLAHGGAGASLDMPGYVGANPPQGGASLQRPP